MSIQPTDLVSIERMREHLVIDSDDDSEDALILLYASAALGWCLWFCDEPAWTVPTQVPAQVATAMLLVLTDFYEHRSSQAENQLYENKAAKAMLFSCRNWYGGPLPVEGGNGTGTA